MTEKLDTNNNNNTALSDGCRQGEDTRKEAPEKFEKKVLGKPLVTFEEYRRENPYVPLLLEKGVRKRA